MAQAQAQQAQAQARARVCGSTVVALGAVLAHACGKHPPPVFTVDLPLACPGQVVVVRWEAHGRATLRAERGPDDWDEQEVAPSGKRSVAPAVTTTFKLTLPDVNPADGPSFGDQKVVIPKLFDERRVIAECDAATARCTGSFALDATSRLQVRKLSAPIVVQAGHAQAMEVCVTHDGLPRTCVGPGQAIDIGAGIAASGGWTLDAALPAGAPVTPPPALAVHLDFVCH